MDSGTVVYRGRAYIAGGGYPTYYVQQGTATGIQADGRQIVRMGGEYEGQPVTFEPADGWRATRADALRDAIAQLDALAERFRQSLSSARQAAENEVAA